MIKETIAKLVERQQLSREEAHATLKEIMSGEATPAQIALNWMVNYHGDTVLAIPGASAVQHAHEAAGAMQFKLTDVDLAALDDVSRSI